MTGWARQAFGLCAAMAALWVGTKAEAQSAVPFTANQVAYFPLDSNASDTVGTAVGASAELNVTYQTANAKFGGAAQFAGNGYISASTLGTFPTGNSASTYSFWFRANPFSGRVPLAVGDGSVGPYGGFHIMEGGAGYCAAADWAMLKLTSGPLPSASAWHHMVVTWDGTTLRGYMDGVAWTNTATGFTRNIPTNGRVTIGNGWQSPSTYNYPWRGEIDDVRIYNRALSSSEVAELYAYDPTVIPGGGGTGAAIPTLSEWGMLTMFGLLAGSMLLSMRRKKEPNA